VVGHDEKLGVSLNATEGSVTMAAVYAEAEEVYVIAERLDLECSRRIISLEVTESIHVCCREVEEDSERGFETL
jgi:hypothetical protein